ncbi:unnamed protein product [Prorocentrum cordatum]|uniref:Uncharacterized protein n=1 Tax=Prorocentrum cordatum TaxID=2364126 RepID=A0ABN9SQY1_9DINO|nr:unnamed protein product [Polarella glacialis]
MARFAHQGGGVQRGSPEIRAERQKFAVMACLLRLCRVYIGSSATAPSLSRGGAKIVIHASGLASLARSKKTVFWSCWWLRSIFGTASRGCGWYLLLTPRPRQSTAASPEGAPEPPECGLAPLPDATALRVHRSWF